MRWHISSGPPYLRSQSWPKETTLRRKKPRSPRPLRRRRSNRQPLSGCNGMQGKAWKSIRAFFVFALMTVNVSAAALVADAWLQRADAIVEAVGRAVGTVANHPSFAITLPATG